MKTSNAGVQSLPAVRFLSEPDAQGRPQFMVTWRDTTPGGNQPNGTGTGYRYFAIDGIGDTAIFEDGFESGDTTSWSDTQP